MRNSRISSRALVVAPIADPHEFAELFGGVSDGMEYARVRGFVPGPCVVRPAVLEIQVANHAAVGEDAVVIREIVRAPSRRVGNAAVVRVVENEAVIVSRAMLADASAPARADSTRAR